MFFLGEGGLARSFNTKPGRKPKACTNAIEIIFTAPKTHLLDPLDGTQIHLHPLFNIGYIGDRTVVTVGIWPAGRGLFQGLDGGLDFP